ncbi:3-hydroxyisobutyrate dehydrogenase 1 [Spatholobus suberectus]|nr:3-hydroxyisobutyrate dehydrogenase 1 [Spatholobus suberectus]
MMVGLVEGMVYAHMEGLDVGLYQDAISIDVANFWLLDLDEKIILKKDLELMFFMNHFVKDLGICLKECQNMGFALPNFTLAQQLYVSLKPYDEGNLDT